MNVCDFHIFSTVPFSDSQGTVWVLDFPTSVKLSKFERSFVLPSIVPAKLCFIVMHLAVQKLAFIRSKSSFEASHYFVPILEFALELSVPLSQNSIAMHLPILEIPFKSLAISP